MPRITSYRWCCAVIVCFTLTISPGHTQAGLLLPYDSSNQVWYDNDFGNDYIDWYLMAVASSGLVLRGMTTTSTETPDFKTLLVARARIVADGRASGFRNIPDTLPGADRPLVPPTSGRIEDTQYIPSAGTVALIAAAHRAVAETGKPLVVCVGGPLTAVATAYLRDPAIAGKVIVAFVDLFETNFGGYNGQIDPWAAYIVLERLPLVYFPASFNDEVGPIPRLSKTWIAEHLPLSPARDHMLSLQLDVLNESDGDADGMSAVSIVAGHYVRAVNRVSFGGWLDVGSAGSPLYVPMLRDDPSGPTLVVTRADAQTASVEYQRAFLTWAAARVNPSSSR